MKNCDCNIYKNVVVMSIERCYGCYEKLCLLFEMVLKWFVILTNKSSETQVLPKMIRYIIHLYRHSLVEFNKSEVMVGLRWTVVWVGDGCSNTEVLGVGTVSRGRIVMFSKPYYIRFSIFLVKKR